jgi:hypothetical protein
MLACVYLNLFNEDEREIILANHALENFISMDTALAEIKFGFLKIKEKVTENTKNSKILNSRCSLEEHTKNVIFPKIATEDIPYNIYENPNTRTILPSVIVTKCLSIPRSLYYAAMSDFNSYPLEWYFSLFDFGVRIFFSFPLYQKTKENIKDKEKLELFLSKSEDNRLLWTKLINSLVKPILLYTRISKYFLDGYEFTDNSGETCRIENEFFTMHEMFLGPVDCEELSWFVSNSINLEIFLPKAAPREKA